MNKRSRTRKKRCPKSASGEIYTADFEDSDEILSIKNDVYDILTEITIPMNKKRQHIQREGHGRARSVIFGEVFTWGESNDPELHNKQRYELSNISEEFPKIKKILFKLGYILSGKRYRSVCVNDTYQMNRHKDSYNCGVSFIVGLGEYEGGELRVYTNDSHVDYDIRKGVFFNGSELEHEVLPFSGRRYSLVYFNHSR